MKANENRGIDDLRTEDQKIKKDKRIYTLSEEKPAKAVVKMGVPLIAGMLIMVLYNLVDTFFIGLTGDDYQLAAVNLAYPVMMVMIAVSNMIGTGASSLIARCLGGGETAKAEHTLTAGFELTLLNSVIVSTAGIIFLQAITTALGAKSNTFGYTHDYVFIILAGSFFVMGNYTFGQFLRSEGSVRYSIMGMVAGTIANIVLMHYLKGRTLIAPRKKFLRPDSGIVKEVYWVGVPASLETLLTSAAYIVLNNLAVSYGELTVAAMGISQKVLSLGSYVYQGFAAGVQPLMGYNYGAKNFRRMIAVLKSGIAVVTGTELFIMAVCGVFAPFLIGIFTDSAEVISIGSHVMRTIMWILPFVGTVSMCRLSFQAMGKPMYAFGITLVRQVVLYVPMLLLLDHVFGFDGMIWAQPVTEFVMMIVSVLMLVSVIRKEEARFHDDV